MHKTMTTIHDHANGDCASRTSEFPMFVPYDNLLWQQDEALSHYALISLTCRIRLSASGRLQRHLGMAGLDLQSHGDGLCSPWRIIREKLYQTGPVNLDTWNNSLKTRSYSFITTVNWFIEYAITLLLVFCICYNLNGQHFEHYKTQ